MGIELLDGLDNANEMLEWDAEQHFSLPADSVERFRLRAARRLFADLRPQIPFLDKLSTNQHLERVERLEDLVPVLFQHTVYKSYPLSLLEKNQFDRLTRWLDQLTTHDLGGFDASNIESIDDWITALDTASPVRVTTSSATGGKLSFLPRSETETSAYERVFYLFLQPFRDEHGIDLTGAHIPIVLLGYREGSNATQRRVDRLIDKIALTEDRCIALYPARLSCDVQSLAGRLRAAEERGERGRVSIGDSLLERRDEFVRFQEDKPMHIERFLDRLTKEIAGQQVVMSGTVGAYLDVMLAGEKRGITNLFHPTSAINAGGGFKGRTDVPADWYERLCQFVGIPGFAITYGMTELMPYIKTCREGHFHIPPYTLPFVLDPDNGESLPRVGVQTGRFAFVDLLAESYWGGFISGDEVTMVWDRACACGRTGAYLDGTIERYSVKRGGDDKISCAGVGEAHDEALEYLLETV